MSSFLIREKERVWNCVGVKWEDLGGVEEGRIVIRIHWMKKSTNKRTAQQKKQSPH